MKYLPPFFSIDELVGLVVPQCEELARCAADQGLALTPELLRLAVRVGVMEPEKIRLLIVPRVPMPRSPEIRSVFTAAGLSLEHLGSITQHHAIIMREGQHRRSEIWCHELRHVAHHECFGGTRGFMTVYVQELIHFGYGLGPLEIDAKHAELLA
ncbi:MAG: hypothetical protein LBC18_06015 [Opitutaceae bacterium]|jgi:hypothetical protein|nr:hypothetical protein [Opitutaceae bacterium]